MAKEKAVIRTDMSHFKWTLNEMRKHKAGYFMALPFFILFFIFLRCNKHIWVNIKPHTIT